MLFIKILNLLHILIIFPFINAEKPEPTQSYTNQILLESPDILYLYWSHDKYEITFELHLKYPNFKWLAFGVSNNYINDIIITSLNLDETGHFSDRKILFDESFSIDPIQNWYPLDAFTNTKFSVFKFKRNIKLSCDKKCFADDLDIENGLNKVVYTVGRDVDYINGISNRPLLSFKNIQLLDQSVGPFECVVKTDFTEMLPKPSETYQQYVDLIENGIYRLYWNYNNRYFTGEIHVKTLGWIGFGFSPNGQMNNSDVFVGWIDLNARAHFTDRFLIGRNAIVDKNQNWKLLKYSEQNEYSIFKFERPIQLCDLNDRTIDVKLKITFEKLS
jgi:hypothetical protein